MKKIICIILIFFASVSFTKASENPVFHLSYPEEAVAPRSEFLVKFSVASEASINALSATLLYSSDILELVSLNTGSSIIDFWVKNPDISKTGTVFFEGGMSISFKGTSGEIASLLFRVKRPGTAQISIREARAYYADGKGTLAEGNRAIVFVTGAEEGTRLSSGGTDIQKPKFKEISLAMNPIEGKRIIVFDVRDNDSGIKETLFRYRTGLLWSEWFPATNPIRLAEKTWTFEIKAEDNFGNVATHTQYLLNELLKSFFGISSAVITLILLAMGIILFRKKGK